MHFRQTRSQSGISRLRLGPFAALFVAAMLLLGPGCAKRIPGGQKILKEETGKASYYAAKFQGKPTASGEKYDMHVLTAAHRNFPFGTRCRVLNLQNGKSVIVRINDRGPWKRGRIIDLSLAAAKKIDMIQAGIVKVKVQVIKWGGGK